MKKKRERERERERVISQKKVKIGKREKSKAQYHDRFSDNLLLNVTLCKSAKKLLYNIEVFIQRKKNTKKGFQSYHYIIRCDNDEVTKNTKRSIIQKNYFDTKTHS